MQASINAILKDKSVMIDISHMASEESGSVSADVLCEYISVCELELLHNHRRITDRELVMMRCGNLNALLIQLAVKVYKYKEQQSDCPNYIFESYVDIEYHKELINSEIIFIKNMWPELERYDSELFCKGDEDVVRELYHNLFCYRELLQELIRVLSCPNSEMLKRLYAEADRRMTERYGLKNNVSVEVERRGLESINGKPTSEDVKRWIAELFEDLERKGLGGMRDVLDRSHTKESFGEEIGRYIFKIVKEYKFVNECNKCRNIEELLRCVMEGIYRYEEYMHLDNKEVAVTLKVSTQKEIEAMMELVNAVPFENISSKLLRDKVMNMWQDFLENSLLHGRLTKTSRMSHKGLNIRMVGLLFGRCIYHNVYCSINAADMGRLLSKVSGKDANLISNYIRDGQMMKREREDIKETVDEIIKKVLVKK